MASTHFTTGTTITSEWLNDVNDAVYEGNITAEGVQYTPPFTGGVTETVEAKLAQTISVIDFGADNTGTTDCSAAVQAAIDSLNGLPGTIIFPAGTYKPLSKVSCFAGQNFIGEGATIDATVLNDAFFAYNEADTFDFNTSFWNPTVIEGFMVKGTVVAFTPPANPNFFLARINRTPYVTIRNCQLYFAACADVVGESIICTFQSVNCYRPVTDSFVFRLGNGTFGPNNSTLINCEIEEQKYPCNGIKIECGSINVLECYMESLTHCIFIDGGSTQGCGVNIQSTNFGLRWQPGSTAIRVDGAQPQYVSIMNSSISLSDPAPGGSPIDAIAFNFNAPIADFKCIGNSINQMSSATENNIIFAIKSSCTGVISNNYITSTPNLAPLALFSFGSVGPGYYWGEFSNNNLYGYFGNAITFNSAPLSGGYFGGTIQGNKFLRIAAVSGLASASVIGNQFDGPASGIQYLTGFGGVIKDNVFSVTGWTTQNALVKDGNVGLFGQSSNYAPQIQTNAVNVTSLGAGAFANVVVPIPKPYRDALYTAVASTFQTTYGATTLVVDHICEKTATQVTVVVKNNSGSAVSGDVEVMFFYQD